MPIDLDGFLLKLSLAGNPSVFTHSYDFTGSSAIGPGETLRLWLQGTRQERSPGQVLGPAGLFLPDRRGRATLRTFTDIVSACDAWGRISC